MTTNLKEYTLLSLGDSFTFGQGTIPPYERQELSKSHIHKHSKRTQWSIDCNRNSYTEFLSKHFKKTVNFGSPGASNDVLFHFLRRYVELNPKENIFVLFNLTDPQRGFFMKYDSEQEIYRPTTFGYNYSPLSKESTEEYYANLKNNLTMHYDMYCFKLKLQDYFYLRRLKNFVFSAYDITDFRLMKHANKFLKIDTGVGFPIEEYIGNFTDDFKKYIFNIENDMTIKSYLNIKKLRDKTGYNIIEEYLQNKAIQKSTDKRTKDRVHLSPYLDDYGKPDNHYSRESHIELAKLLENYVV